MSQVSVWSKHRLVLQINKSYPGYLKKNLIRSKASHTCDTKNASNMGFTITYFLRYLLPVGRREEIWALLQKDYRETRKQTFLSHNTQNFACIWLQKLNNSM